MMDWLSLRVCELYSCDPLLLKTYIRISPYPEVRQIIWSIINDNCRVKHILLFRQFELATYFKRDHSTVIFGIRKIADLREVDNRFKEMYDQLSRDFYNQFLSRDEVFQNDQEHSKELITKTLLGSETKSKVDNSNKK